MRNAVIVIAGVAMIVAAFCLGMLGLPECGVPILASVLILAGSVTCSVGLADVFAP